VYRYFIFLFLIYFILSIGRFWQISAIS